MKNFKINLANFTATCKSRVVLRLLLSLCLLCFTPWAFAVTTGPSLGDVSATVTGSFANLAKLITAAAYVSGMGFALAAILKFKQHKDNPQIPIGTPIALLFIAAALIFLPTIFGVAGSTIFGGSASAAGVSGVTS